MASDNLMISDDEYRTVAYKVECFGAYLAEAGAYYCKILQYILDEAVQDEDIYQGFSGILEQVKPLVDNMSALTTGLSKDLGSYIEEIDESDSFLY